jgi:hypothetical protein
MQWSRQIGRCNGLGALSAAAHRWHPSSSKTPKGLVMADGLGYHLRGQGKHLQPTCRCRDRFPAEVTFLPPHHFTTGAAVISASMVAMLSVAAIGRSTGYRPAASTPMASFSADRWANFQTGRFVLGLEGGFVALLYVAQRSFQYFPRSPARRSASNQKCKIRQCGLSGERALIP